MQKVWKFDFLKSLAFSKAVRRVYKTHLHVEYVCVRKGKEIDTCVPIIQHVVWATYYTVWGYVLYCWATYYTVGLHSTMYNIYSLNNMRSHLTPWTGLITLTMCVWTQLCYKFTGLFKCDSHTYPLNLSNCYTTSKLLFITFEQLTYEDCTS